MALLDLVFMTWVKLTSNDMFKIYLLTNDQESINFVTELWSVSCHLVFMYKLYMFLTNYLTKQKTIEEIYFHGLNNDIFHGFFFCLVSKILRCSDLKPLSLTQRFLLILQFCYSS